jgi:hypothetical protein
MRHHPKTRTNPRRSNAVKRVMRRHGVGAGRAQEIVASERKEKRHEFSRLMSEVQRGL